MKSSKEKRLGAGRVAFLARVEIFKQKIEAGHTMQEVYDEYQKDLGISYSQFAFYVNRYIKGEVKNEVKPQQTKEPVRKPRGTSPELPKFKRSSDDRDDLY